MTSHPLKSYKVQQLCGACIEKNTKIETTMSRVKNKVSELNLSVQRLRKLGGVELLKKEDEEALVAKDKSNAYLSPIEK